MLDMFRRILLRGEPPPAPRRARLRLDHRPDVIYAIGDIHGCLEELHQLEDRIVADARALPGEKYIVTLGDYIDRGPNSAAVVSHLISTPPGGFKRVSLAGNHEQMLLDFLAHPRKARNWLDYGGRETVMSYGLGAGMGGFEPPHTVARTLGKLLPAEHLEWFADLPISLEIPGYLFVHAGVRPGVPMELQTERDLTWIGDEFIASALPMEGTVVVHGHTVTPEVVVGPHRIAVDTGAYATGRLSAVRIDASGTVTVIANTDGRR